MIDRTCGTKRLPRRIEPFFGDCDLDRLRWAEHRDFITKRILLHGNWDSIRTEEGQPKMIQEIPWEEAKQTLRKIVAAFYSGKRP